MAPLEQGQTLYVSVSLYVWFWLAALKRGGWSGSGRVVVGLAAATNRHRQEQRPAPRGTGQAGTAVMWLLGGR